MKPYYEDTKAGITIYHGDCREVLPTLGKVDLVLTDPPYGIGFAAQPTRYQRANGMVAEQWDNECPQDVIDWLVKSQWPLVVWGGNYFALPASRGWLAWLKAGNAPSMADLEMAWTSRDMNARWFNKSVKSASLEKSLQFAPHPTQKPLGLMRWSIEVMAAPDGGLILDPFMGSGTTLRAAKDLGRKAIGIELEERYCEIAANRLRQEVLFGADA